MSSINTGCYTELIYAKIEDHGNEIYGSTEVKVITNGRQVTHNSSTSPYIYTNSEQKADAFRDIEDELIEYLSTFGFSETKLERHISKIIASNTINS